MVLDIGGGSTEISLIRPATGTKAFSLPLGAVYLTERFIKNDPPSDTDLERLRQAIRSEIEKLSLFHPGRRSSWAQREPLRLSWQWI